MTRATVQIADDHLMFAEPNGRYLALHYDVHPPIVKLSEVAPALQQFHPTVLLLDISFGKESSLPLVERLVKQYPKTAVVMVTGHADRGMLAKALDAGARGYVLKDGGPAELLLAIETVRSGQVYLSPELRIADEARRHRPNRPLSRRQLEVLQLLRQGRTEQQIADRLDLSLATTEKHVRALKSNLNIVQGKRRVAWKELLIEGITSGTLGGRPNSRKGRFRP
jgi:DNA-binding NarL/FixJ family response regulator